MSEMVLKVAAKAVIVNEEGKILIVRQASTYQDGTQIGKYGMPGGRLNSGESYEAGLTREVAEETGLEVEQQYPLYVGEWHPIIRGIPTQIIAIFTVCKPLSTQVTLSDEHDEYRWIDPSEAKDYAIMAPEDKVMERFSDWQKL